MFDEDIDYQFAVKFVTLHEKICKYHETELDYSFLSGNPLITMAYVNKHPKKPWCWQALTSNPSISLAYMDAHPEKPWQPDEYHFRKYGGEAIVPDILSDLLPAYYANLDEEGFPPCNVWSAANVQVSYIARHMEWIDQMVALGYDDSEEMDYGAIIWSEIAENPNLTLEFIETYYQKPWNPCILSMNPLTNAKAQFRKEYLAAYKIQQAYARAKYIPTYAYCRKLHLQFYHSMYSN